MTISEKKDGAQEQQLKLFGRTYALPRSRLARVAIGIALIFGGLLGFLPVLGFWMVPLGILVLSQDIPVVRRFKRKFWVRFNRWWARRQNQNK